ncbi:MAG TPA: AAA domain-containing protein [Patescibacteria group bacterium]|nr:AAA domain-containing protein [Patescibacteria group bacterium]
MLSTETAFGFYEELTDIITSDDISEREKILRCKSILGEIYSEVLAEEFQFFSSIYAQSVYIFDKFAVPEALVQQLHALRIYSNKIYHSSIVFPTEDDVCGALQALCQCIAFFSTTDIPASLLKHYAGRACLQNSAFRKSAEKETVAFIETIVLKVGKLDETTAVPRCPVRLMTEEFGPITVVLKDKLAALGRALWKGAAVNLFDIEAIPDRENIFTTNSSTLVVIEPDVLIDVTEIAECFQGNGSNPKLYFLKKFFGSDPSVSMVVGNLVNACFDGLLKNPEADFDEIFETAIRYKPLQALYLMHKEPGCIEKIKQEVLKHFFALKEILPQFQYDSISVEPSFISAKYGLQGRLDAMFEYDSDEFRKTIIELKSGKPPALDYNIQTSSGGASARGLWQNHYAQTTCYNLLLDSTFSHRTGSSQILYSQAQQHPVRNAPNIAQHKQEVLILRNWIVAIERMMMNNYCAILETFTTSRFGIAPSFVQEKIHTFATVYENLSTLEQEYFHAFLSFILREQNTARIGAGISGGFSSLWKATLDDKIAQMSILAHLELDEELSDFENLHLVFKRTNTTSPISTIRKGDIAIVYPVSHDGSAHPLSQQIIKCSVREVTPTHIAISLRNKQVNKAYLTNHFKWVIEPDIMESGYAGVIQSLFTFLKGDKSKRDLLLGVRPPQQISPPEFFKEHLSSEQNYLLQQALSAKDYFLLQGPPGTGKTSVMLKTMVEYLYHHTNENILILAFTNRAVDEICAAVLRIAPEVDFIRIGGKDTTAFKKKTLADISSEISLIDLKKNINRKRVFIGTVSALHSHSELLTLKNFDTTIIDEASQLLEPHLLSILAASGRFILIGDEKQLPAVVTQKDRTQINDSEALKSIHLERLSTSLFERLLRCCKANGWHHAYGMLSRQGRMHSEIQHFVNEHFYEGKLGTVSDWQLADTQHFDGSSRDEFERILATSRMVYISSLPEKLFKVNRSEAVLTAQLIDCIRRVYGEEFSSQTVGIITPFRSQGAEIYSALPEDMRSAVSIDTVERFQGSERDIIILSFAVNKKTHLKMIESPVLINAVNVDRKLNVALTRARHHLIILGVETVFKESVTLSSLISNCFKSEVILTEAVQDNNTA